MQGCQFPRTCVLQSAALGLPEVAVKEIERTAQTVQVVNECGQTANEVVVYKNFSTFSSCTTP